jgi:hypothetical protein
MEMLVDYGLEIKHITKDFDEKQIKKLNVESLMRLNDKIKDLESDDVEKSLVEIKRILRNISDKEPKQNRLYNREFELLKKKVIDEFGYHEKGSIMAKYTGLGLVFGVAIGAGLSTASAAFSGAGIAIGLAIGAGIGSKKEKEEVAAGNIY